MSAQGRWLLAVVVAGVLGLRAGARADEGASASRRPGRPVPPGEQGTPRASSYEALRAATLGLPPGSIAERHTSAGGGLEPFASGARRDAVGREPPWV